MNDADEKELLEFSLLLEAIAKHYGYNFHDYAEESLFRRIKKHIKVNDYPSISSLIPLFLHNRKAFFQFIEQVSVPVTEMFRDPDFFQALRLKVIPFLKAYPFIKIWHAGCATGQEVYSMAVILEEEGLLGRCRIYATDFNESALTTARSGIFTNECLDLYEKNYKESGGNGKLSDYYHKKYNSIKFHDRMLEKITFANHNLVTDGVFGEMNLILCRNVLIYFNRDLQDRVLNIFTDSLCHFGFLCTGKRENISFSPASEKLDVVDRENRIFRKK